MGVARMVQDSERGQSEREKVKKQTKTIPKELPDGEVKKF